MKKNIKPLFLTLLCFLFLSHSMNGQFLFLNDVRSVHVSGPGYNKSESPASPFIDFDGNVSGAGGVNPNLTSLATQISTIAPNSIYASNYVRVSYSYSSPGGTGNAVAENRFEVTFSLAKPTLCQLSGYEYGDGEILSFPTLSLRSTQQGTITSIANYFPQWYFLGVLPPDTYTLDLDSGLNWNAFFDQFLYHYGGIRTVCRLTTIPSPLIVSSPVSSTVSAGGTATFSVLATGDINAGIIRYQWFFNGNALSAATNAALTLTNVASGSVGSYSVEVRNLAGSTTSAPAFLSLLDANLFAGLSIVGIAGHTYRIEYRTSLSSTWIGLTNLVLPSNSYTFIDPTPAQSPRRFYRAILQ